MDSVELKLAKLYICKTENKHTSIASFFKDIFTYIIKFCMHVVIFGK